MWCGEGKARVQGEKEGNEKQGEMRGNFDSLKTIEKKRKPWKNEKGVKVKSRVGGKPGKNDR